MKLIRIFHFLQKIRKSIKIIKSHFLYRGHTPRIHHVHIRRKFFSDKLTVIQIFPHDTVIAFRIAGIRCKMITLRSLAVHDAG